MTHTAIVTVLASTKIHNYYYFTQNNLDIKPDMVGLISKIECNYFGVLMQTFLFIYLLSLCIKNSNNCKHFKKFELLETQYIFLTKIKFSECN